MHFSHQYKEESRQHLYRVFVQHPAGHEWAMTDHSDSAIQRPITLITKRCSCGKYQQEELRGHVPK